jgi:ethanolamine utilization microcompartment shell protein EutS
MAVKIQFIKSPSPGTMAILARRRTGGSDAANPGAVGLVQGALADMITAADVAEKAAQVDVEEIRGICPQHVTLVGIFGEIADVDTALKAVTEFFALQDQARRLPPGERGVRG